MMDQDQETIFSAGPCSVCGELGDAIFVKSRTSDLIFFLCPACGCSWLHPPQSGVVNTIDPPARFAPDGISLPTREMIISVGYGHLIKEEYSGQADRLAYFM
jgi:hypothetical protein